MRAIFILLAVISVFSSGCGTYRYKGYDGPTLPESEIATIETDNSREVQIAYVDGKKTMGFLDFLFWGKWPGIVSVKPGRHEIVPCFSTPSYEFINGTLKIDAQAGQTYRVKHKLEGPRKIIFWIEGGKSADQAVE